jgi:hypothetical protein
MGTPSLQQWPHNCCLQVFGAGLIPDSTCSNQWSLSLNLVVPASALEAPSDGSSRLTQLLKVYAGDGTALSGPAALGWPTVHLSVSQEAATLLVQWGDGAANSRALNGSVAAGRSHIAVVRDYDRLGERSLGDISMACCCCAMHQVAGIPAYTHHSELPHIKQG